MPLTHASQETKRGAPYRIRMGGKHNFTGFICTFGSEWVVDSVGAGIPVFWAGTNIHEQNAVCSSAVETQVKFA